jgi:hypothetical protein
MLMSPAASTHAYESNRQAIWLEVVAQAETSLTLRAPADGTITVPGPHMLFVNGVHADGPAPSEAAWIDVQPSILVGA